MELEKESRRWASGKLKSCGPEHYKKYKTLLPAFPLDLTHVVRLTSIRSSDQSAINFISLFSFSNLQCPLILLKPVTANPSLENWPEPIYLVPDIQTMLQMYNNALILMCNLTDE